MYFTRFLIFCLILLLGCNSQESPSSSTTTRTTGTSFSGPKYWPYKNDQKLALTNFVISENFSADEINAIEQMAQTWEDPFNGDLTLFNFPLAVVKGNDKDRGYTNLDQYNDEEMGIYKSPIWFSDVSSFALAITQYYGIRKNVGSSSEYVELVHADIIMNYRDFLFSLDLSFGTYDFSSVVLHEIGHFIGLSHASFFTDSVMAPSIQRQVAKKTLTTYDQQSISENYAALLPTSSQSALSSALMLKSDESESTLPDQPVHGVIEYHADGYCFHYLDGKLEHIHHR